MNLFVSGAFSNKVLFSLVGLFVSDFFSGGLLFFLVSCSGGSVCV